MRRLLQIFLLKPILWASNKFASKPQREKIFEALTDLRQHIKDNDGKKGLAINLKAGDKFIIFSDQHRGAKNGADDFMNAEPNYLAALDYYFQNGYSFISLGDCEELWENTLAAIKKNNTVSFESEKRFIQQNRFYKVFGNHDLYWDNDPLAGWQLNKIYEQDVKVYEGMILQLGVNSLESGVNSPELGVNSPVSGVGTTDLPAGRQGPELRTKNSELSIFLTHGHQGDASSDGNWFSKFFVANIWAPLQAYLKINPNTPAYNTSLKTEHNRIMYEWSSRQKNLLLITGHTHQPVFESLTHPEKLYRELLQAKSRKDTLRVQQLETELNWRKKENPLFNEEILSMGPTYFNSGCCCFSDGDITGIEISYEKIALIKWSAGKGREVLEQTEFINLLNQLK